MPDLVYKLQNCGKCSDPLLTLTTYPIVIYTKAAVELGLDKTYDERLPFSCYRFYSRN